MDFFEKLMLAKQLKFSDGRMELFGSRFAIAGEFIGTHTMSINNDADAVKRIYNASKESSFLFFMEIGNKYKFSVSDYINWGLDIYKFCGWGVMRYEKLDKEEKKLAASVKDSLIGIFLKGKVDSACDHITRGFIAGETKATFNTETECLEIKCVALGSERCVFVAGPVDDLKLKYPEEYARQIKGSL